MAAGDIMREVGRGLWRMLGSSCLIAAIVVGFIALRHWAGEGESDHRRAEELTDVITRAHLGMARIESIPRSYRSRRTIRGEYLDAYDARLDIAPDPKALLQGAGFWRAAPLEQGTPDLGALELVAACAGDHQLDWFPHDLDLNREGWLVAPWLIELREGAVAAAEIGLLLPGEKRLLFAGCRR